MKVRARLGGEYRELKNLMRGLELHTVCEEAGCPNIYECWADRTATFMILGDRCTRACGFCLVDTRRPLPLDPEEPGRVAEAVARMGLAHAVITSVARDDVPDGGAAGFAATIAAVRARTPQTTIEVLIPDCRGDADALQTIFDARPDVLNHNLETVARLQRAARPSANYARSLARAGPGQSRRAHHEVGRHPRHGGGAPRGARGHRRPPLGRRRHPDRRPVPPAHGPAPAGRPLVASRRVRRHRRLRRRPRLRPRRIRPAGPFQLPRQAGGRVGRARGGRPGGGRVTRRRLGASLTAGLVAVVALVGCGGGDGDKKAKPPGDGPPGGAGAIRIDNFEFKPQKVVVKPGTTVTWTNAESDIHDIKDLSPLATPVSPSLGKGDTFTITYGRPGTYDFVCGIHPYMTGSVEVMP